MKFIKSLFFIMIATACNNSPKAKTCRLGDEVEFKFAERNLFYSDICENKGEVLKFNERSEKSTTYMIEVKCKHAFIREELIWIDSEDIVKVLRLGKDKYKKEDKNERR